MALQYLRIDACDCMQEAGSSGDGASVMHKSFHQEDNRKESPAVKSDSTT